MQVRVQISKEEMRIQTEGHHSEVFSFRFVPHACGTPLNILSKIKACGNICAGPCQHFSARKEAILAELSRELPPLILQVGSCQRLSCSHLLCCSQLQFSCISWVRRSHRGLQHCERLLLIPCNLQHAWVDTHTCKGRQMISLRVCDPQGQQPTAAPVPLSEALNDLSKIQPRC